MLYKSLLAFGLASSSALQLGAPAQQLDRRAAIAKATGFAAALGSVAAASAAGVVPNIDSSTNGVGVTGVPRTYAAAGSYANSADKRSAGVRLNGEYSDAGHPGCFRKVVVQGGAAIITGADEDGKPWKVRGKVEGATILVDFSSKGGPKDVVAKAVAGVGLVFPDGNKWTKL